MAKRKWHDYTEQSAKYENNQKRSRDDDDDTQNKVKSPTHPANADSIELPEAFSIDIPTAVERAIRILEPPDGLNLEQRKQWRLLTRTAAANMNDRVQKAQVERILQAQQTRTEEFPHEQSSSAFDQEPPSGLSKGQRKRWRKRMRTAMGNASADTVHLRDQTPPQINVARTASVASPELPSTLEPSTFRKSSSTSLQTRPQKVWDDQNQQHDSSIWDSPSLASSAMTKSSERETPKSDTDRKSVEPLQEQPERVVEDSQSTVAGSIPDNVIPKSTPVPQLPNQIAEPRRNGSERTAFISRNTPVTMSFRRSSFGRRAIDIPSTSGIQDVEESFKRFSAFLRGRNVDSSDDDSDESDENSDSVESQGRNTKEPLNPAKSDKEQNMRVEKFDGSVSDQRKPADFSVEVHAPILQLDGGTDAKETENELPKFSLPELKTPSAVRANVGVKRQLSFLDHGAGGNHSGAGGSVEHSNDRITGPNAPSQHPGMLEVSDDDSENVLETVDEISRNIFSTTRPLPASKLRTSPDPNPMGLENELLTSPSSDRRVTRSMATPKSTPKHNKLDEIPILHEPAIVCNTVRVPEFEDAGANPMRQDVLKDVETAVGESDDNIEVATKQPVREDSSSSLSELARSPSAPPSVVTPAVETEAEVRDKTIDDETANLSAFNEEEATVEAPQPIKSKRKMTGRSSKHFKTEKRRSTRTRASIKTTDEIAENNPPASAEDHIRDEPAEVDDNKTMETAAAVSESTRSSTKKKRKGTGKKSSYFTPSKPPLDPEVIDRVDFYNTTTGTKRVPAGVSVAPVPPITSARFGIIQEKLWQEPFWLLIAVTFLNQTTGRAAVPVFWDLKKRYPSPEALAEADQQELCDFIQHLGLQRVRSKRMIEMAKAWVESPPVKGRRWRRLHYPVHGDGKDLKPGEVVEEDADDCAGALEIGHIPGCGPYAWDSWRIFCRDVLRGVADDYNGVNSDGGAGKEFVPEWRKVLPKDKELRACLRWMWLRDGWIWDCENGERRPATEEEMRMALKGEMEVADEKERVFAAQVTGEQVGTPRERRKTRKASPQETEEAVAEDEASAATKRQRGRMTPRRAEVQSEESTSDNIVVSSATKAVSTPRTRKTSVRRSARLST